MWLYLLVFCFGVFAGKSEMIEQVDAFYPRPLGCAAGAEESAWGATKRGTAGGAMALQ